MTMPGSRRTSGSNALSSAPAPTGGEAPRVNHGVLLLKAAGVASVDLIAHHDTWEWLTALAVDHDHFRTPPSVEDVKEGRVQTVLSGRSLIGLLINCGTPATQPPHWKRTGRWPRPPTTGSPPNSPASMAKARPSASSWTTDSPTRPATDITAAHRPAVVRNGLDGRPPWHSRKPSPISGEGFLQYSVRWVNPGGPRYPLVRGFRSGLLVS